MSDSTSSRPAVLGVIPARLGSQRLPRKPLHPIAGRPLIEWVWRRARTFAVLEAVVVATDSDEVVDACRAFGADVTLTAPTHESGTERVAEVAARPSFQGFDVVANIQGDEPFLTEEAVAGAVAMVTRGWDVGTAAAPVTSLEAWRDPAVVKVVRNDDGGALYFSRAPVPHARGRVPSADELASDLYLRHIGVYAYRPEALARWVTLPVSPLEALERLEQLRALAAGMGIGVAVVGGVDGGIDTEADVARAEGGLASGVNDGPVLTTNRNEVE